MINRDLMSVAVAKTATVNEKCPPRLSFFVLVMVSLLETALEDNSHAKPVRESILSGPFTLPSLRNSISFSYLSRRVVPSINIPYL